MAGQRSGVRGRIVYVVAMIQDTKQLLTQPRHFLGLAKFYQWPMIVSSANSSRLCSRPQGSLLASVFTSERRRMPNSYLRCMMK